MVTSQHKNVFGALVKTKLTDGRKHPTQSSARECAAEFAADWTRASSEDPEG